MQSDDLGQFPLPPKPQAPVEPIPPVSPAPQYNDPFSTPTSNVIAPNTAPVIPTENSTPVQATSFDTIDTPIASEISAPSVPAFEETPDEIPSILPPSSAIPSQNLTENISPLNETPADSIPPLDYVPVVEEASPLSEPIQAVQTITEPIPITPTPPIAPQEIPATNITKSSSSIAPIIFIGLLLVAGIGLAVSVFLFSQSAQLKKQLVDITQTLESQRTTVTPTPTPTPIEAITPSSTPTPTTDAGLNPERLPSLTITPSASPTATITITNKITPLLLAQKALKVAINSQPNAQLILIKSENASSPTNSLTKYFFRQDLKIKKYFYVTVSAKGDTAIIDKAIYVTPDNNIPSLNEAISTNNYGIDLDKAIVIAYDACKSGLCQTASLKAQFIKSNENYIWQLTFTPADTTKDPLIVQLNSLTKEILYKSAGF